MSIHITAHPPGDRTVSVSKGSVKRTVNWSWTLPASETSGDDTTASFDDESHLTTGTASLSIEMSRPQGVAPAGVFLEAKLTGADVDDAYCDPVFRWSFDDPGNFRYLSPDFFWRDKNLAWGPMTMHAWHPSAEEFAAEKAASGNDFIAKTVTCECRLQNRSTGEIERYVATKSFRLENPDVVFAGTRTVCFSAAGEFAEAPAGAQQVTSYAEALAALDGVDGGGRLLLRRGEVYTDTGWDNPNVDGRAYLFIGDYGSAAEPPEIRGGDWPKVNRGASNGTEVAIFNLKRRGNWEGTDPYCLKGTGGIDAQGILIEGSTFTTIYQVDIDGFNTGIQCNNQLPHLYIFDVSIENWFNYGFYQGRGWDYVALRGANIRQKIGTVNAEGKGDSLYPRYPNHGPGRITAPCYRMVLQNADIRSLNTWSGNNDYQPWWRFGGRDPDHPYADAKGRRYFISTSCIRAEGGSSLGMTTGMGGESGAHPGGWVVEKLYVLACETKSAISANAPGQTVRNCIVVIPSAQTPEYPEKRAHFVGSFSQIGEARTFKAETYANHALRYYNNTFVDLRDYVQSGDLLDGQLDFWEGDNADVTLYTGGLTLENQTIYGPQWDRPSDEGPFDMSSIWTPTIPGRWTATAGDPAPAMSYPEAAHSPADAPAMTPLPESAAFQSADTSAFWALDNIWGEWRDPAAVNRGAV